jgi:hypothetical protein
MRPAAVTYLRWSSCTHRACSLTLAQLPQPLASTSTSACHGWWRGAALSGRERSQSRVKATDIARIVRQKTAMLAGILRHPERRVLLYAARHGAPLPPAAGAEAEERGARAMTSALCFSRAAKLRRRTRNSYWGPWGRWETSPWKSSWSIWQSLLGSGLPDSGCAA